MKQKMASFNYFLLCSTSGCKEGKKIRISLHNYDKNGNCLLTDKEKREFAFLCKDCCKINFIKFELIINRETLKFIKRDEIEKQCTKLFDELNKFELN